MQVKDGTQTSEPQTPTLVLGGGSPRLPMFATSFPTQLRAELQGGGQLHLLVTRVRRSFLMRPSTRAVQHRQTVQNSPLSLCVAVGWLAGWLAVAVAAPHV